jgi:hypothetical protein
MRKQKAKIIVASALALAIAPPIFYLLREDKKDILVPTAAAISTASACAIIGNDEVENYYRKRLKKERDKL